MTIVLDAIRPCLEGATPALLATVAADGTPNVSYLSQVHYVDPEHVALSFQFFNKTRENVLATRRGLVRVYDPDTAAQYQIALEYLRTETEGPLFEGMKAKLAGIASHTGMSKVFRLRGSDVFRVLEIVKVLPDAVCPPAPRPSLLQALRTACRRLARCTDLDSLLGETLSCLREQLGIEHAMVLMHDRAGQRLYTVASAGYAASGVGSEIPLGAGVIGVAARERTPIRITHLTGDASYSRAARESCSEAPGQDLEMEIPLPGLAEARSQMAMPILARGKLLGVIHLESTRDMRFTYAEEDALAILADHVGTAMLLVGQGDDRPPRAGAATAPHKVAEGQPVSVRRFAPNDSIFLGDEYLIKGVAGAILWRLLGEHTRSGRAEFSNRELRFDPSLHLPEIGDNLEARLILLQRRLVERCDFLRIVKTGRGRFRLEVMRPVELIDVPTGGTARS